MGGVCDSLNGWPGNRGTRVNGVSADANGNPKAYRENSGAHDSRERPAHFLEPSG
jgi:hypothetical protein